MGPWVDGQLSDFHDLDQPLPSHEEEPGEEREVGRVFYHSVLLSSRGKIEPHLWKGEEWVKLTPQDKLCYELSPITFLTYTEHLLRI